MKYTTIESGYSIKIICRYEPTRRPVTSRQCMIKVENVTRRIGYPACKPYASSFARRLRI